MASRKYFLSITAMMLVLFFMFMFSEIVKSSDRDYNNNNHAKVTPIVHKDNERDINAVKVGYMGKSAGLRDSVAAWCRYTKKNFTEDDPAIIVVDSKSLDATVISELDSQAKKGVVLIFAGFPDKALMKENGDLRRLMGVSEIKDAAASVTGTYLFSGFLLGGEKRYFPEKDEEKKYMDFTRDIPWIIPGKGSKTYMSALTDDTGLVQQDSPALIWRAVTDKSVAFVIFDDYTGDKSIQGVMEACIYEASDFSFSPVVNANVFTVADFALLSEENSEVIKSIYSRTTQSLVKEIIWPRLMSFSKRGNLPFTCFFNTKLDKNTENPIQTNFSFFLREMREISAEAAMSGNSVNDTLKNKLTEDFAFYKGSGNNYDFTSIYLETLKAGDIQTMQDINSKLYALTLKDRADCDYVDAAGSFIINAVTQDASVYSYKADFETRSLATAMGYNNNLIDMKRILRPEYSEDQWQIFSENISGFLTDYWSKISKFDMVTASEAAVRTSAYLKNTAACSRKGRTITVTGAEPGYFLLRTHGEVISDIKNASFVFLEKDAYLITITNNQTVEITVE